MLVDILAWCMVNGSRLRSNNDKVITRFLYLYLECYEAYINYINRTFLRMYNIYLALFLDKKNICHTRHKCHYFWRQNKSKFVKYLSSYVTNCTTHLCQNNRYFSSFDKYNYKFFFNFIFINLSLNIFTPLHSLYVEYFILTNKTILNMYMSDNMS